MSKLLELVDEEYRETYKEVLGQYTEGVWIEPTDDDWEVFNDLGNLNLVAMKTFPMINDGNYLTAMYYLYKHDLNYPTYL